ncbi:MAG TPA: ATP-binding protein [Polyangia bacterium]|nr:ATP-binding protein [Polyangia bacterium]
MEPRVADASMTDEGRAALARTNLSWLLRLRWGAVFGQLVTILAVRYAMDVALPLGPLLALVAAEALSNAVWYLRPAGWPVPPFALGALMALDVVLLSGLLYFTGGPHNPFSFLFLVPISLATLILTAAWTWALVLLSLACSAVLFAWNVPLELGPTHAEHMAMHLRGMWVAFGVSSAFIVYFLRRIRRALARREAELTASRSLAARRERLASLATLAAGAAHELSTPLSTIAVVAKELERAASAATIPPAIADDVRLVRAEVERCRAILARLSTDAGEVMGEAFVSVPVDDLVRRALAGLEPRPEVRADVDPAARGLALRIPPRAVQQALHGVLKNAQDASPADAPVTFGVARVGDLIEFTVRDRGAGMPPDVLARVGEPFFTTKPAGRGMGLGVFLARAVVERLGGAVTLDSVPREGTTARIAVPLGARPAA